MSHHHTYYVTSSYICHFGRHVLPMWSHCGERKISGQGPSRQSTAPPPRTTVLPPSRMHTHVRTRTCMHAYTHTHACMPKYRPTTKVLPPSHFYPISPRGARPSPIFTFFFFLICSLTNTTTGAKVSRHHQGSASTKPFSSSSSAGPVSYT